MISRGGTERKLTESAALWGAAEAADHVGVKLALRDAPATKTCVETGDGAGPRVGPSTSKKKYETGKGPELVPDGRPHWDTVIAGFLNELVDGIERGHRGAL